MPLPTPLEVKELYPLSRENSAFIERSREAARRILTGQDSRKVLIVGPCSIHNLRSAEEYARKFRELSLSVQERCLLVMRVYFEKPRTSTGWKGLLYDPHLDGSHDIKTGLVWTRELLLNLTEMQVPCATEFVDPLAAAYYDDLITWGFVGARTSASQPHRQFASHLKMPLGFKNATDGTLDHAVLGTLSARQPHAFLNIDEAGKICAMQSSGNPWTHIVLRGAQDFTNYDSASIKCALEKLEAMHLPTRLMIDCSHGNCGKRFERQEEVFNSVIEHMERGHDEIFGLMLESHLEKGNQPFSTEMNDNVSITDPCIDWQTTEELIYSAFSAS